MALSESTVVATLATSDLAAGKKFYGEVLGLKQIDENPGGVTYQSGDAKLFIYQSGTAGSGQATCASWSVDDIGAIVDELEKQGVTFEHYDMPGITRDGAVHSMGSFKAVWFKDPDGNILNATQM